MKKHELENRAISISIFIFATCHLQLVKILIPRVESTLWYSKTRYIYNGGVSDFTEDVVAIILEKLETSQQQKNRSNWFFWLFGFLFCNTKKRIDQQIFFKVKNCQIIYWWENCRPNFWTVVTFCVEPNLHQ